MRFPGGFGLKRRERIQTNGYTAITDRTLDTDEKIDNHFAENRRLWLWRFVVAGLLAAGVAATLWARATAHEDSLNIEVLLHNLQRP